MRYQLSTSRDGRTYSRMKFAYANKLSDLQSDIEIAVQQMNDKIIQDWYVYDKHKDVNMSSKQVLTALENARKKG